MGLDSIILPDLKQCTFIGSKAVVDALPPQILALFTPKPPIANWKAPLEKKCRPLDGIAQYLTMFEDEAPPKAPPVRNIV